MKSCPLCYPKKTSTTTERNDEESFDDLYADCPSDFEINCTASKDDTLPKDSYEFDIASLPYQITK